MERVKIFESEPFNFDNYSETLKQTLLFSCYSFELCLRCGVDTCTGVIVELNAANMLINEQLQLENIQTWQKKRLNF